MHRSPAAHLTEDGLKVIDALVKIADARTAEPATVALAWLLAKGATAPIASASRPEQLPALMAVRDLTLTAEEVAELDRASQAFA
jgi:aryl-alcohol dehydrogenase-like predicted oxidoreductase